MSRQIPILFKSALDIAVEKAKGWGNALGNEIVLVRDLHGRIRVLLPGTRIDYTGEKNDVLDKFSGELSEALGVYGFTSDGQFCSQVIWFKVTKFVPVATDVWLPSRAI